MTADTLKAKQGPLRIHLNFFFSQKHGIQEDGSHALNPFPHIFAENPFSIVCQISCNMLVQTTGAIQLLAGFYMCFHNYFAVL